MIIYEATNKKNGKAYIGQTIFTLEKRRKEHCRSALAGTNSCRAFANSLRKYGASTFAWTAIDKAETINDLNVLEEFYIEAKNTIVPNGYNLRAGGKNRRPSAETRKKISDAGRGNQHAKGYKHSASTRRFLSEGLRGNQYAKGNKVSVKLRLKISERLKGNQLAKGFKHSEETRRKKSMGQKGRKHSMETLRKMSKAQKGRTFSAEHRQKLSDAMTGRVSSCGRPVIINGKYFRAVIEAAKNLGINKGTLRSRIISTSKKSASYSYAQ